MTDLTPELERWAGDATATRHYARQLKATLERVNRDTLLDDTDLARLHAHALHLQQQATIERLEAELKAYRLFYGFIGPLQRDNILAGRTSNALTQKELEQALQEAGE